MKNEKDEENFEFKHCSNALKQIFSEVNKLNLRLKTANKMIEEAKKKNKKFADLSLAEASLEFQIKEKDREASSFIDKLEEISQDLKIKIDKLEKEKLERQGMLKIERKLKMDLTRINELENHIQNIEGNQKESSESRKEIESLLEEYNKVAVKTNFPKPECQHPNKRFLHTMDQRGEIVDYYYCPDCKKRINRNRH